MSKITKLFFIIVIYFLQNIYSLNLFSQSQLGLKIGSTINFFDVRTPYRNDQGIRPIITVNVGAVYNKIIDKRLSVLYEIQYGQKGYKQDYFLYEVQQSKIIKNEINNKMIDNTVDLNIVPNCKLNLNKLSFFIGGGAYFSYCFNSKLYTLNNEKKYIESTQSSLHSNKYFDYGMTGLIGVKVKSFQIGINYLNSVKYKDQARNRAINMSLIYYFHNIEADSSRHYNIFKCKDRLRKLFITTNSGVKTTPVGLKLGFLCKTGLYLGLRFGNGELYNSWNNKTTKTILYSSVLGINKTIFNDSDFGFYFQAGVGYSSWWKNRWDGWTDHGYELEGGFLLSYKRIVLNLTGNLLGGVRTDSFGDFVCGIGYRFN